MLWLRRRRYARSSADERRACQSQSVIREELGGCISVGLRDGGGGGPSSPRCLLVLKIDVEGAEFALAGALLRSVAHCIVDELFVEVHWNRRQQTSGTRQAREHTWDDAVGLVRALRGAGVFTHLWH